ncbi:MAG: 5'-methylthioadenosine/adenosylhomocysteine nucleosidase [Lachnospiraceae bacterium]|jgi:adenosylhomocysteine nucleosidase|uniref:5'-methylthioadenosine/adenosylhomocysteine nucleosidase n=1 Tax=Candidatus Merdisoma sp. JLR.KK011 TaxID=3114299 RepID=UPI001434B100|nr:5'-methylthioadenosine/adenosylhomocysteine nucleosidase [Lachnospiraceae bacterium]MCI9252146.1 5'-methylthioadenosine/adenosylhomocysteine nucleosidase [Lachnospiraceae bacterium]MCI9383001.1 5'-methylthioadenosine/adenosylhomocysteine nucleosidase [Lachnospiraceae bacterium]MCI9479782.1 5'-methylthioadenosine/adenosylhomocysteine nucleosidase [Lachnospiraceae bacterium]MCI9623482.1 5'-methylthioadenosine/adenosylhomocysteine nucleosidase [Lachnospiraceae bacterium]
MGRIGIIGAMEEEIALLKEKMEIEVIVKKASMEFYQGTLNGREIVVVRSGIGKVNAGLCAQILIDVFHVNRLINTGIAGSLKADIDIGDIVISSDALQHDMDARNFGYARGEIPRMDTVSFPADSDLISIAKTACEEANPDIKVFVGRIVTGDQFIAERTVKNEIASWTEGYCTEMEGAAIAQAAYLNKVPFVIVRAISDKADDSASMDYPTFEQQAILHSVKLIEAFVSRIPEDTY